MLILIFFINFVILNDYSSQRELFMRFADIIGHNDAIRSLREMVDSDRIPHAILLSGPSGIGKMRLARAFLAYLNCENPVEGDSCGSCPSCRRIASGNDPDIHYVFPIYKLKSAKKIVSSDYLQEWNSFLEKSPYMDFTLWMEIMNAGNSQPQISVEESDSISQSAAMSSFADRYKVFIIWLPEKMGAPAANKLLKLLEEPHDDTLFLCVSNDPASILPTVLSRLHRISLIRPSDAQIEQTLLSEGISPLNANNMARLSEGSLLKAFNLAAAENETEEFSNHFRDIMRASYARKAGIVKAISESISSMGREKNLRLLDYFARMIRENFIANLCLPPLNLMSDAEVSFSKNFAPFINAANVEELLSEINLAKRDISRNANAKLVWFDLLVRFMILLRKKPET